MTPQNVKRSIAAGAALVVTALAAPAADAQTLQRSLLCEGAEPNAVTRYVPAVGTSCANGTYDPVTETYAPYDPATDDNGLIGLNNTIGRDVLGL